MALIGKAGIDSDVDQRLFLILEFLTRIFYPAALNVLPNGFFSEFPEYSGEAKIWTRNGHIPGAVNVPWKSLVEENNSHKFKPVDAMRKVFADKGIRETDDIIVYCGTSREASLEYMVLKHILRFPKVRLYEGSWAEYSNHKDLPVETGS